MLNSVKSKIVPILLVFLVAILSCVGIVYAYLHVSDEAINNLSIDNSLTSFAVYSATDNSLNFYKRSIVPVQGETWDDGSGIEREVTSLYNDIETSEYTSFTDLFGNYNAGTPWYNHANNINRATIVDENIQPISTAHWFEDMSNVETIDVDLLDTSKTTSMRQMFNTTSDKLIELDVSNFDTSNVINMYKTFATNPSLDNLDLSSWNTSNVTTMQGLFRQSYSLNHLDVSNFDTSNVTDMSYMFYACKGLEQLDLSSWDVSNVEDVSNIFNMYKDEFLDTKLSVVDIGNWNLYNLKSAKNMFYACTELESLVGSLNFSKVHDASYIFSFCASLKSVDIKGISANTIDICGMFNHCSSLIKIDGLETWDTSNIEDMSTMFNSCELLETLDLSTWNTIKVTDMSYMFGGLGNSVYDGNKYVDNSGCYNLETIIFGNGWDVSNVKDMCAMFTNSTSLKNVDFSKWHADSVISVDFDYMFDNSAVDVIDFSNILEVFPSYLKYMFYNCSSLVEIKGIENWDTSNITSTEQTFRACKALREIDISGWDLSNVTNANSMFNMYWSATKDVEAELRMVDMTGTNFASLQTANYLFQSAVNLQSIYVNEDFYVNPSATGTGMFTNDSKLRGNNNTLYSSSLNNIDSLSIDTYDMWSEGNQGLLTLLNDSYVVFDETQGELSFHKSKYVPYWDETFVDSQGTERFVTYVCKGLDNIYMKNPNGTDYYFLWHGGNSAYNDLIESAIFVDEGIQPVSTSSWFEDMVNLIDIVGLDKLDTAKVADMSNMFYNCSSLTSLDVSNFDTSEVTDMSDMFYNCSSFISINLSNWDMSKVIDTQYMFGQCSNLNNIEFPVLISDTYLIMDYMFSDCTALEEIDFSNWILNNVWSMDRVFDDCKSLQSIKGLENWNTSDLEYLSGTFCGCNSLVMLDLSSWDTSNVIDVGTIEFAGLSDNDADKWYYQSLFGNCKSLQTIYASEKLVFPLIEKQSEDGMFFNCNKLYGGLGSASKNISEAIYRDITHAYIDGTKGDDGYFTPKIYVSFEGIAGPPVLYEYGIEVPSALEGYNAWKYVTISGVEHVFFPGDTVFYDPTSISDLVLEPTNIDIDYAVYSETDNSLNFYKRSVVPEKGSVWDDGTAERIATMVYTNIETRSVASLGNAPWSRYYNSVQTVSFVDENISPVSTAYWFYKMSSLTNIYNLSHLNTENVTTMHCMFDSCSSLTSLDLSTWNTSNVETMSDLFYNCSSLNSLNVSNWNVSKVKGMTNLFAGCASLVELDLSNWDTSESIDMISMYSGCNKLTKIQGIEDFDTSHVEDMSYMFYGCSALVELDLIQWDTSNVENMSDMFEECQALSSLNISGFNTSQVIDMSDMFHHCSSIVSLDVSNWDTSKVENMAGVFYCCFNLETLDVSSWNTGNVTNMSYLFGSCETLKILDLSNWDTSNVIEVGSIRIDNSEEDTYFSTGLFADCRLLETIYVSDKFNLNNVEKQSEDGMFFRCDNLYGGLGSNPRDISDAFQKDITHAHIDGGESNPGYFTPKINIQFSGKTEPQLYKYGIEAPEAIEGFDSWYYVTSNDVECIFKPGDVVTYDSNNISNLVLYPYKEVDPVAFAVYSETDNSLNFYKRTEVPVVGSMFNGVETSYVYTGIETLNTNSLDNVPWVSYRTNVKSVTFVDDGIKPKYTANWFYGMNNSEFRTINGLARLDTSDSITMKNMFFNCSNISDLDVSNFDTGNVINMNAMFNGCKKLETLDITSFNTSNVTDMGYMFAECSSLSSLDVTNFDTTKVKNMMWMFLDLSVTSLDVTNMNVSNVTNMSYMFDNCLKLEQLDLSTWNTTNLENTFSMFSGCSSLKTIYVSPNKWNMDKVSNASNMFLDCKVLTGGLGTKAEWSSNGIVAHIDLEDNPGLFTPKITVQFGDDEPQLYYYGIETPSVLEDFLGWIYNDESGEEHVFFPGDIVIYNSNFIGNLVLYQGGTPAKDAFAVYTWNDDDGSGAIYLCKRSKKPSIGDTFEDGVVENIIDDIEFMSYTPDVYEGYSYDVWVDENEDAFDYNKIVVLDDNIQPINISSWFVQNVWWDGLTSFEGLDKLDTSKTEHMDYTFVSYNESELDLSSWDFSGLKTANGMFKYGFMTTIYISDSWNVENIDYSENMFEGCYSLEGPLYSSWSFYDDYSYQIPYLDDDDEPYPASSSMFARIDDGDDMPGYFTKKYEN